MYTGAAVTGKVKRVIRTEIINAVVPEGVCVGGQAAQKNGEKAEWQEEMQRSTKQMNRQMLDEM